MSFKDIEVFVDCGKQGVQRGRFAIAFARRHEAHLTIFAFVPTAIVFAYGEPGVVAAVPASYFDDQRKKTRRLFDELKAEADRQGVSLDVQLLEGVAGDLPRMLLQVARYADLMIVGQPEEGALWSSSGETISRLLMDSGRPVLVVPRKLVTEKAISTIIAAWDGSAEATRSFHDALPLLKSAQKIILYAGGALETRDVGGDDKPGEAIARHLSHHGIDMEVRQVSDEDLGVGELIVARALSEEADLVVMGGFHHSRLRELLIGGVTKSVLEDMAVPVFMSH